MALKMDGFAVNFSAIPPVTTRKGIASPGAQERLGGTKIGRLLRQKTAELGSVGLEVQKEYLCGRNSTERGRRKRERFNVLC